MPTYKAQSISINPFYTPPKVTNDINVQVETNSDGHRDPPGVTDYEQLTNKPSIEYVTLIGNKNFPDLGLTEISIDDLLEILV